MTASKKRRLKLDPGATADGQQALAGWKHLPREYWPTERFVLADYNPRSISDEAFEELVREIEYFGLAGGLDARAEDGLMIGGHQRYRAANVLLVRHASSPAQLERMNMPGGKIPVNPIAGMPDNVAAAFNVALNNPRLQGDYDMPKLRELLSDLDANGFDATLTGFSLPEIGDIITWQPPSDDANGQGTPQKPEEDPNVNLEPDDTQPPESKLGEVYELGQHRLMCGDSTSLEDVARLMAGARAHALFTDPPYGVAYRDTGAGAWDERKKALKRAGLLKPRFDAIAGDELTGDALSQFLVAAFAAGAVSCEPTAAWYVWHASRTQREYESALNAVGYEVRSQIIWHKSRPAFNFSQYKYKHEPGFYAFRTGQMPAWYGDRSQTTVWDVASESGAVYEHPTQKPSALARIALLNSTRPEEIVLDLFGGSGSTLIGAEQVGRNAFVMEIDPRYCDVIRRRFAAYASQLAPAR